MPSSESSNVPIVFREKEAGSAEQVPVTVAKPSSLSRLPTPFIIFPSLHKKTSHEVFIIYSHVLTACYGEVFVRARLLFTTSSIVGYHLGDILPYMSDSGRKLFI